MPAPCRWTCSTSASTHGSRPRKLEPQSHTKPPDHVRVVLSTRGRDSATEADEHPSTLSSRAKRRVRREVEGSAVAFHPFVRKHLPRLTAVAFLRSIAW